MRCFMDNNIKEVEVKKVIHVTESSKFEKICLGIAALSAASITALIFFDRFR